MNSYQKGHARDLSDGRLGEGQRHILTLDQRNLLADQVGHGLGQNAEHIILCQALQVHPDGQAALELGEQVGGLGYENGVGVERYL